MPETMSKKAYQRYTQEFKDKAVLIWLSSFFFLGCHLFAGAPHPVIVTVAGDPLPLSPDLLQAVLVIPGVGL